MSINHRPILVFGVDGFLGNYFYRAFEENQQPVIGFGRRTGLPFDLNTDIDISNITPRPSHALITAGVTKIAKCQNDPQGSHLINVERTFALAASLCRMEIIPVVFSSDYVFDGKDGPFTEKSLPNPLNEYGKQKFALEKLLEENFPGKYLLFRLPKVYSIDPQKKNLLTEIIEALRQDKSLFAATDQIFNPVDIRDVFEEIHRKIQENARGLFNLGGYQRISRYELCLLIKDELAIKKGEIIPIKLKDLNESFTRPANTVIVSEKIDSSKFSDLLKNIQQIGIHYE